MTRKTKIEPQAHNSPQEVGESSPLTECACGHPSHAGCCPSEAMSGVVSFGGQQSGPWVTINALSRKAVQRR